MAELKRAKSVLQAETRETAASRQLEAAVAELAGLLKGAGRFSLCLLLSHASSLAVRAFSAVFFSDHRLLRS